MEKETIGLFGNKGRGMTLFLEALNNMKHKHDAEPVGKSGYAGMTLCCNWVK